MGDFKLAKRFRFPSQRHTAGEVERVILISLPETACVTSVPCSAKALPLPFRPVGRNVEEFMHRLTLLASVLVADNH